MANVAISKIGKDNLNRVVLSVTNDMIRRGAYCNASYLDLLWKTKAGPTIRVGDMSRAHVRNTLQWCLRKGAGPDDEKDGIRYADWIAYFTMRLLDPDLGE